MNKLTQLASLILAVALFSGCAKALRPINPSQFQYANIQVNEGIEVGYRYNILNETNNERYAKKASNAGYFMASVMVTNNTDEPITIGQNAEFTGVNGALSIVPNRVVSNTVRQKAGLYFLHLLWFSFYLQVENSIIPIGLVIAPVSSLANFFVAKSANDNFTNTMVINDLNGQTIQPGDTRYGILTLMNVMPITIEKK